MLTKMKEKDCKAEILNELKQASHVLLKKYNEKVDTNLKVIDGQEGEVSAAKAMEQGIAANVELYTTAHLGSTLMIHDFVVEYLNRRGSVQPSINPSDAPGPGGNVNGSVRSE
jgi:hypothetical protein